MNNPSKIERLYEPVIDQHESWIAVNGVQGCNKGCGYCFLEDRGLTRVRPVELATPAKTLELLLDSRYYRPTSVLALYTCTDALSTPRTRKHLTELLDLFVERGLRNPVCLITKCGFTPDVLECLTRTRAAGLPVIVYLSYSGLGPDVEQGINHDALRANFPALHAIGIPVIHYWRPFLPQNSTPEAVHRVLGLATQYAQCSVAVGLKVKPGARDQMAPLWPALKDPGLDVESASSVWPATMRETVFGLAQHYRDYPVFETNSCALSHVLKQPDTSNILGSSVCQSNLCPLSQRERCAIGRPGQVTRAGIDAHLAQIGIPGTPYDWEPLTRTMTVKVPMTAGDCNSLAHTLSIRVRAERSSSDHYWPGKGSTTGLLIIDN
ncbi:hypothetical protein ACFV0O_41470 [Kitasatospora sp. NPDC059577]|uniref:hypothetical protein n=1 Tax=unclassified Kitasatospora TaxID=2633591 RepID=UPI0036C3A75A